MSNMSHLKCDIPDILLRSMQASLAFNGGGVIASTCKLRKEPCKLMPVSCRAAHLVQHSFWVCWCVSLLRSSNIHETRRRPEAGWWWLETGLLVLLETWVLPWHQELALGGLLVPWHDNSSAALQVRRNTTLLLAATPLTCCHRSPSLLHLSPDRMLRKVLLS